MSRHGECGDVVYYHAFHQAKRLLSKFEDDAEDATAWGVHDALPGPMATSELNDSVESAVWQVLPMLQDIRGLTRWPDADL